MGGLSVVEDLGNLPFADFSRKIDDYSGKGSRSATYDNAIAVSESVSETI